MYSFWKHSQSTISPIHIILDYKDIFILETFITENILDTSYPLEIFPQLDAHIIETFISKYIPIRFNSSNIDFEPFLKITALT